MNSRISHFLLLLFPLLTSSFIIPLAFLPPQILKKPTKLSMSGNEGAQETTVDLATRLIKEHEGLVVDDIQVIGDETDPNVSLSFWLEDE